MSRPEINSEIEPLVDIITTDNKVKVILEMLGVSKDDIKINAYDGNLLEVKSNDPRIKYYRTIEIPKKLTLKQLGLLTTMEY